ncbi:MAG: cell division ATP-binding protein FtsE [Acidimicrobiales bacterium]
MIKLNNVSKTYKGEVVALRDATVDIAKGEFVFLVGASGSGKSTFLRLVNREERPTDGEIWVAGKNTNELSSWKVPYLRRNIGSVYQDFKLLPNKTVAENVSFALEVIGRPRHVIKSQVPAILELVGLAKKVDRFPDELSGGEQQRVSIARAFVNRPLILLADEPTGNLDPQTSVGIMKLLDRINRTGTTVVMATHDRGIVDTMRRRVIELDRGQIVRDQARGVYE